jgi:hypothetical protein
MMKLIIPCLLLLLLLPGLEAPAGNELPCGSDVDSQPAPTAPSPDPAGRIVKLPGLSVDLSQGHVDLEAEVCLEEGILELIACTKGTKEHESIVAIAARPMHVHTALLLLGANSGHPAMQTQVNAEGTEWRLLPPRGDLIDVSLVFTAADGEQVVRPITDFVARTEDPFAERHADDLPADGEDVRFPGVFLFAGSHLFSPDGGPRRYLADESGHVITISTFGDEVLCLPGIESQDNAALLWQVDATHLPKVGSKVILRLRPRNR